MSSYNLIPFTEMSAVAFTTIVTTTTATVDGDVIILDGAKALAFRGLTSGSMATPMYSFASTRGSGMWNSQNTSTNGFTVGLAFSLNGTTIIAFKAAGGGSQLAFGITILGGSLTGAGNGGSQLNVNLPGGFGRLEAAAFNLKPDAGTETTGLNPGVQTAAFNVFGSNLLVKVSTTVASVAVGLGSVWETSADGQHFTKMGLLAQATTTFIPSTARSSAHITNIGSGVTTIFVTLPSTLAGIEHTITNAQGTAQTVVISPRATGDRLDVFGLTKANGASVAANAPFSTITFHCITSTRWVATKLVGAWV